MTYELPRTDDGEVDWVTVKSDLEDNPWGWVTILKAIDTNARAEERETCARECYLLSLGWEGSSREAARACEEYIRTGGDSK